MGSKGSNVTTQNTSTSPTPQALSAYQNVLNTAQGVAATPYNPYSGELVAPVNAEQNQGITGVNNYANAAQPAIAQASGLATGASNPLTASQIQNYYSPYQQDVINSTQAQFNNQNQQQQQQVTGNAIAQGALGGNRTGVAAAELANQQQLAQAPVIAGLENQGYNSALTTAAQQYQQNPMAAAGLIGNLGVAGQTAGLTGAGAQLGAGGVQQTTQQALDTALLQQYQQQQAYPFQTTQWLAGVDTGVGSQMGGTTTGQTTAPAPSLWGQILGAGTAATGALGQSGAFGGAGGTPGWIANAFAAKGGSINYEDFQEAAKKAYGGGVVGYAPGGGVDPYSGGTPSSSVMGVAGHPWATAPTYVPTMNITHGSLPHASAPAPYNPPQQNIGQQAASVGNLAKTIKDAVSGNGSLPYGSNVPGAAGPTSVGGAPLQGVSNPYYGGGNAGTGDAYGGNASAPIAGLSASDYGAMAKGGGIRGFADGGSPDDLDQGIDTTSPATFDQRFPVGLAGPVAMDDWRNGVDQSLNISPKILADNSDITNPTPSATKTAGVAPVQAMAYSDDGSNTDLPPEVALGYSGEGSKGIAPKDERLANEKNPSLYDTSSSPGVDLSSNGKLWPSLLSAGFGMMASRSPFLGNAIGEGGQAGIASYNRQQEEQLAAKQKADQLALEKEKTERPYSEMTADQKAMIAFHQQQLQREFLQPVNIGTDYMNHPIMAIRDIHTGNFLDPVTKQPINPALIARPIPPTPETPQYNVPGQPNPISQTPAPNTSPVGTSSISPPPLKAGPTDDDVIPMESKPTEGDGRNNDVLRMYPQMANKIKAIDEGRMSLAQAASFKDRGWISDLVNQYDPNFDQTIWAARNKQQSDMTTNGNAGKMILAVNQLLPHLKTASDTAEELENSSFPAANTIKNWWATATGDPRVKKFEEVREVASTDAARLLRGSGQMAEKDIDFWRQNLASSGSPRQLQEQLGLLANDLMEARIDSIKQSYRMNMRQEPPDFVSNKAKAALDVIKQRQVPPDQRAKTTQPTTPTKPSLADFLQAAKTHNPGVSDSDLTAYYNKKYGGQ